MQFTLHATRRTPHRASRLVQAMSAWSVKNRRAPSRHSRDVRIYCNKTTAMHKLSTPPPPLSLCLCFERDACVVNCQMTKKASNKWNTPPPAPRSKLPRSALIGHTTIIYKTKINYTASSCKIEDFVEAHLCKLCVRDTHIARITWCVSSSRIQDTGRRLPLEVEPVPGSTEWC